MKNRILVYLLGVMIILVNPAVSQAQQTDKLKSITAALPTLDKLFTSYAEKNHFPALVYGLVVDGKLIHTFNTGYTDLDKKIPATKNSDFRIASMTKSFTAMAILKLRDEGKLKLDDPAYLYIPALKNLHYPTSDAADITIRNLLTHAAGFPEDNPWGDRQLAKSDDQLLQMISKGFAFSNNPGIAYEYSNTGFALLGYIIKKVSGKSYEQYITENILIPLGMIHTYWEYQKVPPAQLAHGYRWLNNNWVEQPLLHDGSYGAMGGMITTIEDFSKYVNFQLSVWPPSNDKETGPVKRSSVREMQHPWNMSSFNANYQYPGGRNCPLVSAYAYGLGWRKDCKGRTYIGHSGGLPGFGSNWAILPDYGIGILCFSNLTYAPTSFINTWALDTLLYLTNLSPRQLPVTPILEQRKNELVKFLPGWENAQASGIFAENFWMDYFPDSLHKQALEIFQLAGKISSVSEMVPENNLRGSFILEGQSANVEVSFTLTPENPPLIQEYHIRLKQKD